MMKLGMWMWPDRLRRRGAPSVVSDCARAGVTDLFFLTKGLSGKTAYPSRFAPCLCERDLLRELTEAAHKQKIRVHVWFTSACDEHYKHLHPESGRYHFVRGRDRELISLADEDYLHYMEKIIREVCRHYEVDGLHLDYIRYNHLLYGWAEEDMKRYRAQGANTERLCSMIQRMFYNSPNETELLFDLWRSGDEDALALARARRTDVMTFAKTLTDAARAERKELILSAALMPEGAYEDKAFADLHYGQNYTEMANLFECVLPMAYSQAYGQQASWVKMVAEGTLKSGMKTLVGLHAYEGGTGVTLLEDRMALEGMPVEGICLFREGAVALALAKEKEAAVLNTLPVPITKIIAMNAEDSYSLACRIEPDAEQNFRLPFQPQTLQVFAEGKEHCIYLTDAK